MPSKELTSLTALQVNTLASNAFVMDQLLLQPENNAHFIEVAKSVVEEQAATPNRSHTVRYKNAQELFKDFEKSVEECRPIAAKLTKEGEERARTGIGYEGILHIHCPCVQRYVEVSKKVATHNEAK